MKKILLIDDDEMTLITMNKRVKKTLYEPIQSADSYKNDIGLIISNKPNYISRNIKKIVGDVNFENYENILPKWDLIKKQTFDYITSFIIILMIFPILLVIGVLIKITSKGPIIFKQKRVGFYGKEFILYKFRTMVVDAEKIKEELSHLNEADGPVFKIKNDPRITKIGKFLRRSGLDELPQFFNVLKGDMSIVGPRPATKSELKCYKNKYFIRLITKPGITCLWQIQKNRHNMKFEDWMNLDVKYINDWSIWQDLSIFIKTFFAIFRFRGQ